MSSTGRTAINSFVPWSSLECFKSSKWRTQERAAPARQRGFVPTVECMTARTIVVIQACSRGVVGTVTSRTTNLTFASGRRLSTMAKLLEKIRLRASGTRSGQVQVRNQIKIISASPRLSVETKQRFIDTTTRHCK